MEIGAVGGIGMSGVAGGAALGGAAAVSGLAATQPSVGTMALCGVGSGSMDQLVQILGEFSTAEILLALMLAQSKRPEQQTHRASEGASTALSMAMLAGSLSSQAPAPAVSMAEMAAPVTGLIGGQINIQA